MKIFKTKAFKTLIILVVIILCRHIYCENNDFVLPDYDMENIENVFFKDIKSEKDYELIFNQTGLSPQAVNMMLENNDSDIVFKLQKLFFNEPEHKKNYIAYPFTLAEANTKQITPLAPLKNGDILITFNTRTCDWRHGHCAIVTDAEKGIILEHMAIGSTSTLSDVKKWGCYPSFIVLRYPDEEIASLAAEYAKNHLIDIEYNIFAGIIKKDKSDEEKPESSHCSHIVWQAYKAVDTDIDRDKGFVVTPENIVSSEKLDVVQIYGMDANEFISRLAE